MTTRRQRFFLFSCWLLLLSFQADARPGDQYQQILLHMRLSQPGSSASADADWARARLAHRLSPRTKAPLIIAPGLLQPPSLPASVPVTGDLLRSLLADGQASQARKLGESHLRHSETACVHRALCSCAVSEGDYSRARFHLQHGDFTFWESLVIELRILLRRLGAGDWFLWTRVITFLVLGCAVFFNLRSLLTELRSTAKG